MTQIKGQLFKMWKQSPRDSGLQKVFLPYFNENKAEAFERYENDNENSITWKKYCIQDNHIRVLTRYEPLNVYIRDIDENIQWEKISVQDFVTEENEFKKNVIHSFVGARWVLNMYLRALGRLRSMEEKDTSNWSWENFKWRNTGNQEVLRIIVDEQKSAKAYSKDLNRIILGKSIEGEFECRLWDFLSHEVGHALLTTLRDEASENRVFHEAFAYLSNIFSLLSMLDICELLVVETQGDIGKKSFLTRFAETNKITDRDMDENSNSPTQTEVHNTSSNEEHKLALQLVNPVLSCLVQAFSQHHNVAQYDTAETLFRVGRQILDLFLYAVLNFNFNAPSDIPSMLMQLNKLMRRGLTKYKISDKAYKKKLRTIIKETLRVINVTQKDKSNFPILLT